MPKITLRRPATVSVDVTVNPPLLDGEVVGGVRSEAQKQKDMAAAIAYAEAAEAAGVFLDWKLDGVTPLSEESTAQIRAHHEEDDIPF